MGEQRQSQGSAVPAQEEAEDQARPHPIPGHPRLESRPADASPAVTPLCMGADLAQAPSLVFVSLSR